MLEQQTEVSVSRRSVELAEQATVRALLNCYFRENGIADPRIRSGGELAGRSLTDKEGEPFILQLSSIGAAIAGTLAYYSVSGQHRYGPSFRQLAAVGAPYELGTSSLIELLLQELGSRYVSEQSEEQLIRIRSRIENSLRKMSRHIEHDFDRQRTPSSNRTDKLDYIGSEQSLYVGHPFHPYPKSAEGFADEQLAAYSPETGAFFQLHYFAVKRQLVDEQWLEGAGPTVPSSAVDHASRLVGESAGGYVLLPMHPWQAEYVMQQPNIQSLMRRSAVVSLGAHGPVVYPTSSVRTVWEPVSGCGYKLPLSVRITNLLRENNPEQTRRTLDAAKIVQALADEMTTPEFAVLSETGFSAVRLEEDGTPGDALPSFTIIYRPMALSQDDTFVTASLLECRPGESEPKLIAVIRQSLEGHNEWPDMRGWLERYLQISMLPLLRLLAVKGISFEAHLQNSLLTIRNGMPVRFYVRDLEGVSIDRRKAEQAGWIGSLVPEDSPVLYEEAEAWMRTKYYFFVNHLGSLVHTIAAYGNESEERYWAIVTDLLQRMRVHADERLLPYVDDLLNSEQLPAKANFTSCFLSRGETPLYVQIPNPMKES